MIGHIKLGIPFMTVGLQDAAGLGQMAQDMLLLPVRGEAADRPGCPVCLHPSTSLLSGCDYAPALQPPHLIFKDKKGRKRAVSLIQGQRDNHHPIGMEPKDGIIWVYGTTDVELLAFTPFGVENLIEMTARDRDRKP